MAASHVPHVPKSNTSLSAPVPFPLKGPPIPLLLLALPSQLGATLPVSAFPFAVHRRRRMHASLNARAVDLDWPVRPWMSGIFSSRRRLQSKASAALPHLLTLTANPLSSAPPPPA